MVDISGFGLIAGVSIPDVYAVKKEYRLKKSKLIFSLSAEDPADLLTRIADSLAEGKKSGGSEIYDDLYHSVACKASIKANSDSSSEELLRLAELVLNDNIKYCPHGRPALVKFTKAELEKLFKRTV